MNHIKLGPSFEHPHMTHQIVLQLVMSSCVSDFLTHGKEGN
jgi:hypothetical protein